MQLDKTGIEVRERGMNEIFDLALHVLRIYWPQLVVPLAMGILPCAALNYFLVGNWANPEYNEGNWFNYFWLMTMLVFIESQVATSLATIYLGRSVFGEKLTLNELFAVWGDMWFQMAWCQFILRAVLPALVIVYFIEPRVDYHVLLQLLLIVIGIYVVILRSLRPYINEVILLERNPFWGANEHIMTLGRRSGMLHDPRASELFGKWLGSAGLVVLLTLALTYGLIWSSGVLVDEWTFTPFMLNFGYPAVLWLVTAYVAVVRFLSYLDLRIRLEGWEVELKLRAEGTRLSQTLA